MLLELRLYTNAAARVRVTEKRENPRWESPDIVQEANLFSAPFRVLSPEDPVTPTALRSVQPQQKIIIGYGSPGQETNVVVVQYDPFMVLLFVNGEETVRVNSRNLFHFEQHRSREGGTLEGGAVGEGSQEEGTVEEKEIVDYGEDGLAIYADGSVEQKKNVEVEVEAQGEAAVTAGGDEEGMWEEKFGTHRDSKPLGPASLGVDIEFPAATHVYGIPEHATSLSLKPTRGSGAAYSEPYRLYNLDVFEYEVDEPMALYGAIPFMMALTPGAAASGGGVVGLFWNNPTETFVDVEKTGEGMSSYWLSESGVVDLWLLPGPSPVAIARAYAEITGPQQLPPLFALGYHQCRWNYKDQADVAMVDSQFEAHNFPYDVLWLDIEHTNGKRYFTWDDNLFPEPIEMQQNISAHGRRMVTIVDPHIKRDNGYSVHTTATSKGLYVKDRDGKDFDGWCWPGSSSYLDFTSPAVRQWWAEQFHYDAYSGSTPALYTWNDMNEPSVFNGPEVSMHKDAQNLAGVEHREWHNMYGFYMQWATGDGQVSRQRAAGSAEKRPFVLSRAFSAGSQRFGAIWTGDNTATWEHLQITAPMLLSISIAGLHFAGADVGGFFGDPDVELMTRWYQAAAYQPFFRGHAHHDSKRREPWLFGPDVTQRLRSAAMQRYALLPYWYTLFADSAATGAPPMRPLWFDYADEEPTHGMDDQWLVGSDLLVKPIVTAGSTTASVYLPGDQPWYDVHSGLEVRRSGASSSLLWGSNGGDAAKRASVQAPIDTIPVFQRGGSVIPRQMRLRRSSALMRYDPYTLTVALNTGGNASGELYLDDFETFDAARLAAYIRRRFIYTSFSADGSVTAGAGSETVAPTSRATLSSLFVGPSGGDYSPVNVVERVVVLGVEASPTTVNVTDAQGSRPITFTFDAKLKTLTLRKPAVKVAEDWVIELLF